MKNLIIYLNPEKKFDDEHAKYVRIQIENSLMFWSKEDIVLATNFDYEFMGVKAVKIPDSLYCDFEPRNSKGNGLVYLITNKILTEDAWLHDFEAFQCADFDVNLEKDLGLTDYGWKVKWNTGSIFLKTSSLDIFEEMQKWAYENKSPDEPAIWNLYRNNFNNFKERYQKLNITYNIGMRHIEENIKQADKPLKVVHFHPFRHRRLYERFKPFTPHNLYNLFLKYA